MKFDVMNFLTQLNISDCSVARYSETAYYVVFYYNSEMLRVWFYDDNDKYVLQSIDNDCEIYDIDILHDIDELIDYIKTEL